MKIISQIAEERKLDERLVAALCHKESAGNTWATRFEPTTKSCVSQDYWKYAGKNQITPVTEQIQQMTSFGLMQVMGYVARSLGFEGPLVSLCDPETGIHYGCLLLGQLFKRYNRLDAVISVYNLGSIKYDETGNYLNRKSYVDPVLSLIAEFNN